MLEHNSNLNSDIENEVYPVEPRFHPVNKTVRLIYGFLASAKLAMFLLIVILGCCLVGATVFCGQRAMEVIFSTLWFNGLLVFLIVNVACCFFGRIWGRKVTLISLGMILFHLSFVALFAGIIYNSLFYFRGSLRLSEGETLFNGRSDSYDHIEQGRFFNLSKFKGSTTLNKVQYNYVVGGQDKRIAYDVIVSNGAQTRHETLYILKPFDFNGFKYFRDKEGFSVLTILYDKQGKELYGAHVALQSMLLKENTYRYTNGTKDGAKYLPFPQPPSNPLINVNVTYQPDLKKERSGHVIFQVLPLENAADGKAENNEDIKTAIGAKYDAGMYDLSVKEVRYWAGMYVRYEPGQPIVLVSLWVGLFGMTLTTMARIFKRRTSKAAQSRLDLP